MLEYIIVALVSLIVGSLITYLWSRSVSIPRSQHDALVAEHQVLQNDAKIKTSRLEESLNRLTTIDAELKQERATNRQQENTLAELRAEITLLRERHDDERDRNAQQQHSLEKHQHELRQLERQLSQLQSVNTSQEEKIQDLTSEQETWRKKSLIEFENIANKLFEEKNSRFAKESKESIEQVLKPLRENLSDFRKKVEDTYDIESKQRHSLEDRIKELVQLNQQISQDATNLTNALKGSSKTQGGWGEMILESILENSGLVKGREYFVQSSFQDDSRRRKQPDVMLKYPDDRYIIIDSKVSLTAYEKWANEADPDLRNRYLKEHLTSLKNHIDNLSSKEYDLYEGSLDFVMLFVPIEPAYLAALQVNEDLWNYAYNKRVVLISPTNLIAALKLVADIWKREHQNNNALEIAKRGEQLYKKFVGFIEDMEDIEKHLAKTNSVFSNAMSKLSTGRGNLIGQAEKLKSLGIRSKKKIPKKFLTDDTLSHEEE